MTDVGFSFLTSGPPFRLSVPPDFGLLPQLESPLDSGTGGRTFTFSPTGRARDLATAGKFLGTLEDRDGRSVELFERLVRPLTWWLRWSLKSGYLMTHIREEDGLDRATLVAGSLSVLDDDALGTPFLLPEAPLRSAASATPGYQEFASFRSTSRDIWSLVLKRPGFLSDGEARVLPGDQLVLLRGGSAFGMEVQVTADTLEAGAEVLSAVTASLREL
jgi:hypothetical protein